MGILQARILEWAAISLSGGSFQPRGWTHVSCTGRQILYPCVLSRSVISDSLQPHGLQPSRPLCPWGFSRQEYWSGLPSPSPGDLPNPRIKPRSPTLQAYSSLTEPPGRISQKMREKKESKRKWYILLNTVNCICASLLILLFEDNICISNKHSGTYDKVFSKYI